MKLTLEVYETKGKDRPFEKWLDKQDSTIRYMIVTKVERLGLGYAMNCKLLGDGITELKIDKGPGYRVYYSVVGRKIVLLLCAGSKGTQQKDIQKAKDYLKDYKIRGNSNGKK